MKYKNENIQIYIKNDWVSYEKMNKLVGGFHYSSAIRFFDDETNYYFEIKSKNYSSIAFPFYYNSDLSKSYDRVFENIFLNDSFPFYIYDKFLDHLKKIIKIEEVILSENISVDIEDLDFAFSF